MKKSLNRLAAMALSVICAVPNNGISVAAADITEETKTISSPVIITEIIPNTENGSTNKLDAYEYYELTNITDTDVDLTNYNIAYVNGSKTTLWNPDITVLPANASMLVWIRNTDNTEKSKTDFCNYYNIAEDSLVAEVTCDGLSNSGPRTLAVATKEGETLVYATYQKADSANGTIDVDESIVFTYDGDNVTLVYDQTPTPLIVNASDINGVYKAQEKDDEDEVVVDQTKAPALVITELIPDTSNMGGADAYEFIEIYNNSNLAINLKDYKLNYTYPDTGVITTWWETEEDKILEAGQTLVFWVKNGANDSLTLDDFNAKFATSLTADQVIEIACGGMANGSKRGMNISTNVDDVLDSVIYNDGVDNTTADKSITYQNQYIDNAFKTVMTADAATPSPGMVTESEKPVYQAQITASVKEPVLTDNTVDTFNNATETLEFSLEAVSEETTVKSVKLYLKYNDQVSFESYKLTRSDENSFKKALTNVDLLNKKSFTYYFEVSDGFHTAYTEEKTITNVDILSAASLNLNDGETITGNQQIIAYGSQLFIDGVDISGETAKSINGFGHIAFEATDTDVFFKNAVAVDGDVVGIFNEGTYSSVRTYVYDIDASKFDAQTKTITVEFHAGNKANVLEHNIENNDDFTIRNVRMVLPNGKTLTPVSYQAKKGLGVVEHDNMDAVEKIDVTVASQETNISMGDGTSKYEILYVTFQLEDSDFDAIRYVWDTKQAEDGGHVISNGIKQVTVTVDNTAPQIVTNMENGKDYHSATIEAEANDALSEHITTVVLLDGAKITVPYAFRALDMEPGTHTLKITAVDEVGNEAVKEIAFTTPKESADIDEVVTPADGSTVTTNPVLSIKATDASNDEMIVTFKKGERYDLTDSNIIVDKGISNESGSIEKVFEENTGNGFPYERFDITLDSELDENSTVINVKWTGISNNTKTFMYVYNATTDEWEKMDAVQIINDENMTLTSDVVLKDHIADGSVKVIVQNGEGYTPAQYAEGIAGENSTYNIDDTPRENYDFTFVVESDTQYYNEDYEGNPDQSIDGLYQHQLNIHNWVIANRERMNIQYLFHDGDIIDDEPNIKEWEQADAAYKMLDEAGIPYGILAGNHDVGHLSGSYGNYSTYFGESRYTSNPWYGESYKDNRGHYDLISVGGIDFIMIYVGWGIGDEEIDWMNEVLAQYPERKAILNFHEYLLASGGLGEEPQRVHDEVIATNENVCMVLSGHYHNAKTTIDRFTNEDGTTRNVYNMLFDYQGMIEGGAGYMRLLHFDLEGEKVTIRTYTASYGGTDVNNFGDYDAKPSDNPNEGNDFVVEGANLNDAEHFEISFADLGITSAIKTLTTTELNVNVYKSDVIGNVKGVQSGVEASYEWADAVNGMNGWYAEVTDENGGLSRTDVCYVNVQRSSASDSSDEKSDDNENGSENDSNNGNTGNSGSGMGTSSNASSTTTAVSTGDNTNFGVILMITIISGTMLALAVYFIFFKKKEI